MSRSAARVLGSSMTVHILAFAVTAISFFVINIPKLRAVDEGVVYLAAALIGVIAFLSSLVIARFSRKVPIIAALVLFILSILNLYFLGYSFAYASGLTLFLGVEGAIRFILSAVFNAIAVGSLAPRWICTEQNS